MPYVYRTDLNNLNFTLTTVAQTQQPPQNWRSNEGRTVYLSFLLQAGTNLIQLFNDTAVGDHFDLDFGAHYKVRYEKRSDGDFTITHYIDGSVIAGPSLAGTNINGLTFLGVVMGFNGDKAVPLYVGDNGSTSSSFRGRFTGYPILNDGLSDDQKELVYQAIKGILPVPPPYIDGGTSTTGGGNGSFDHTSDEIDLPAVPLLNLSLNHFISTYAPTVAQLNDLADFMWSDWLSGGPTLPKIFADPSDAIISLHMLPFTPSTATAVTVTIGSYSTGVSMDPLTLQFYTIDCGELAIEEYWGNYLDYNPYTKLTLFLPYVGEVTLNPDEVMGQTIGIKYRVDALTGAFVCFVTRSDKKILGEYQGNCALEVPISSANYAQLHSALLGLAGAAVSAGAAGITGGVSSLLNGAPSVIKSAAGVMDSKVRHSHSGALGSAAGFLGSQKPYLIIERARQCLPEGLNEFAGYPSQVTATLGDQTGFTSVSEIILDGIPLTDGELSELREILQGGIYV